MHRAMAYDNAYQVTFLLKQPLKSNLM